MKIAGIIAEFNPFHNGHAYLLEQARRKTNADAIFVAMSGDFVQRGEPAIIDKYLRTRAALLNGADVVLQLPVWGSLSSAQDFALCGVKTLYEAGARSLVFGCESDDITCLKQLARLFFDEPEEYRLLLKKNLKEGLSFPAARSKAAVSYFNDGSIEETLRQSNNILAIEYIKATLILRIEMEFVPIKRIAVAHNDDTPSGQYASASYIRDCLHSEEFTPSISEYIPQNTFECLFDYLNHHSILDMSVFNEAFKYKMITDINPITGKNTNFDELLFSRFQKQLSSQGIDAICDAVKTKDITHVALKRFIMQFLLDLGINELSLIKENPITYLRVLGFKKEAISILSSSATTPIITKVSASLDDFRNDLAFQKDLMARNLYINYANKPNGNDCLSNDFESTMVIN